MLCLRCLSPSLSIPTYPSINQPTNPLILFPPPPKMHTPTIPQQRTLESIRDLSSAYWLDVKEKVNAAPSGDGDYFSLEGIIKVGQWA